jgi:hypothetical protein
MLKRDYVWLSVVIMLCALWAAHVWYIDAMNDWAWAMYSSDLHEAKSTQPFVTTNSPRPFFTPSERPPKQGVNLNSIMDGNVSRSDFEPQSSSSSD